MNTAATAATIWLYFGALLAAVALCAVWLGMRCAHARLPAPWRFVLRAVVLGALGAKLIYVLIDMGHLLLVARMQGLADAAREAFINHQGLMDVSKFAFTGAWLGVCLACLWQARALGREKTPLFLDALAAPLALLAGLARLAEVLLNRDFAWFDIGKYLAQAPALQFFPIGMPQDYGGGYVAWPLAVCVYAGVWALLVSLPAARCGDGRPGQRFWFVLAALAIPQVLFESLRGEALSWGFVRAQQLFCALAGYGAVCMQVRAALRSGLPRWRARIRLAMGLLCVLVFAGLEFALDKSGIPAHWCYLAMALNVVAMLAAGRCPHPSLAGRCEEA
ncbi:MAG: hypothetical protein LBU67_00790 [Oscillospiraceae bacterium]|jgi:prolipoprotein diacylglyceryltransferase|nr:hypothetical protein [Oscillospiraceae bacterium]